MNRREFLLAIGASACSSKAEPLTRPPPLVPHAPLDAGALEADPYSMHSNLGDSPLAIEGDTLVERVDDQQWQWDLVTMRRVDVFTLPVSSFTLLPDRSLVGWGRPPGETPCTLYRLVGGALTTYTTRLCISGNELVRSTGTSDSVYIVYSDDSVMRFRFAGAQLDDDVSIKIPEPKAVTYEQITSLGDGRLVATRANGITILAPGAEPLLRPTRKMPRHLARATNGRVWYSYASASFGRIDTLALADDSREQVVSVAPARIVHMASYGGAIALLLMTGEERWHVVLVDESGHERWRAEVPSRTAQEMNFGSVGLSATRLLLHTTRKLRAWDAATGTPVEVIAAT